MAKITQQKLLSMVTKGVLAKVNPATFVASTAIDTISKVSKEKFGYDFLGLGMRLIMFYAVAFLVEWYFKAEIALGSAVKKAQEDPLGFTFDVFKTFTPIGIVASFIFNSLVKEPTDSTQPIDVPTVNAIFNNVSIKDLFSDEGVHGFKYWDIIKMVTLLLVIMEWFRFSNATKATGGQVQPLTHGLFLLFIFAIGLTIIPNLIERLKGISQNTFNNPQEFV